MCYNAHMARPKKSNEPTMVVSVRMPASLHDQIAQLAEEERRAMSQQILVLLERGLQAEAPAARRAARATPLKR